MDFSREEQKILLQALYRFRGDVSGASQSEQNKYALVESVIARIEEESGPLKVERTRFDREMEENLSVLARGGEWPKAVELDKKAAAPKVESGAGPARAPKAGATAGKKAAGAKGAGAKAAGAKGAGAKGARADRAAKR